GGDELEVDLDALVEGAAPVVRALLQDPRRERTRRGRVEADVEEARPGDLGPGDARDGGERRGELLGELPRRHAEALAELEGDVAGPVAVVAGAGPLEGGIVGRGLPGIGTALCGRPAYVVEQDGGEFGGIHEARS